ncbi:copper homeostasis membrane protein CopD [Bradyrhizobium sp. LA6.12]|uniref:copper homeostasis membrane protein CopD n=1 Tax=unclassified Bradyrhizobium TaxID=2631580 RepID=UPI003394C5D8
MDWSLAEAPLVATRAVHFAATAVTVGSFIFRTVIARPVLRSEAATAAPFRIQTRRAMWVGLAVAMISGVIWLLLQAVSMSGMPIEEALTVDVLSTVITETQFGEATIVRAGFAICLAVCLAHDRAAVAQWLGTAAALGFAASLAWTGHAGSTIGAMGYLHLAADALHLTATSAWIGGLLSLILFLAAAQRNKAISLARDATERFSTLGIVSVVTLVLTGLINAAILVGSLRGLIVTEYGRLLIVKLGLFVLMLAFAGLNRFRLTPRLAFSLDEQRSVALRQLMRNSIIEIALGLGIITLVGMLGTLHPAVHLATLPPSP